MLGESVDAKDNTVGKKTMLLAHEFAGFKPAGVYYSTAPRVKSI
jgi:hypothetical protein